MPDEKNYSLNDVIQELQNVLAHCLYAVKTQASPDAHFKAAQAAKEYASAITMLKALENTF